MTHFTGKHADQISQRMDAVDALYSVLPLTTNAEAKGGAPVEVTVDEVAAIEAAFITLVNEVRQAQLELDDAALIASLS